MEIDQATIRGEKVVVVLLKQKMKRNETKYEIKNGSKSIQFILRIESVCFLNRFVPFALRYY